MNNATNTAITILATTIETNFNDATVRTDDMGHCDFRVGVVGDGHVAVIDGDEDLSTQDIHNLTTTLQHKLDSYTITHTKRSPTLHSFKLFDNTTYTE